VPSASPSASVVVAARDVLPYVDDLVGGLRRNAADDVEFVVVDDASRDGTRERLGDLLVHLPNSRLIEHPEPRGLSAARNTGLAASSGEVLLMIDGDDWTGPGYVAGLVRAMATLGVDFVKTGHVLEHGGRRTRVLPPTGAIGRPLVPRDHILPSHRSTMVDFTYAHSSAYSRRLLDAGLLHFREDFRTAEDRDWSWRLMLGADSLAAVDVPGYFYRRGVATSLTSIGDERQLDFLGAMRAIREILSRDPQGDDFMPKALRTEFALVYSHHERRRRLPQHLRDRMRRESQELLRSVPTPLFTSVARGMGPRRAAFLAMRRAGAA